MSKIRSFPDWCGWIWERGWQSVHWTLNPSSIKTVYWIQLSSLGSSKLEPHELNLERSHQSHCSNSSADTPRPASRTCKAQCKAFTWWTFPSSSKRLESIFLDAYRTPFPVHLDVWISWLQPISSGHCGEYFRSKMQHFYQLFCHFLGSTL